MNITALPKIIQIMPTNTYQGGSGGSTTQQNHSPTPTLPTFNPGQILSGIITDAKAGPNGTFLLNLKLPATSQHPAQNLQIVADKPLPTGTQVTVQVNQQGQPQITQLSLPTGNVKADALHQLSQWPGLKQALSQFTSNPPVFNQLQAAIPRPDTLFASIFLFAQAARTSSPESLFGQSLASLIQSSGASVDDDIAALQTLSRPNPNNPQDWRGLIFPYVEAVGEDPQQGKFFWRQNEQEDGEPPLTRFVFEFSLQSIGEVQLDGLHHPAPSSNLNSRGHVDLKLRLKSPIDENLNKDLPQAVQSILQSYGLTGTFQIEITPQFTLNPAHEIESAAQHINVNT